MSEITSAIFSMADKFSEIKSLVSEQKQLAQTIRHHETTCGACAKWMKRNECPKEKNIRGMSRGPSCDDYKCSIFEQKLWVKEFVLQKKQRLGEIDKILKGD